MKIIDNEITQYWIHFQAGSEEPNRVYPPVLIKCYHNDDFVFTVELSPGSQVIAGKPL